MQTNTHREFINIVMPLLNVLNEKEQAGAVKKRRYSRLTFNVVKSYVKTKLNEMRVYGSREADKMIDRMCLSVGDKYGELVLRKIESIRPRIKRWMCKLATESDAERLTGFLVPFVYGGMVCPRNSIIGAVKLIEFGDKWEDMAAENKKERILRAAGSIFKAKSNGHGIIVIRGRQDDIFSPELCRSYQDSPDQAFVLIEECGSGTIGGGTAAYDREVIERLRRLKNIFVLIRQSNNDGVSQKFSNEKGDKYPAGLPSAIAKHRALKSYKILSGILISGENGEEVPAFWNETLRSESLLFDERLTVTELLDQNNINTDSLRSDIERASELIRREQNIGKRRYMTQDVDQNEAFISYIVEKTADVIGNIASNSLFAMILPDPYEILTLIQCITTGGKESELNIEVL